MWQSLQATAMEPRAALLVVVVVVAAACAAGQGSGRAPRPGVHTHTSVFPAELVDRLLKEGEIHRSVSASGLKHDKLSTAWLPIDPHHHPTPRFATEAAIALLREIDYPGERFAEAGIVGAEWWYQVRSAEEDIGFHYDKDEGIASTEMRMVFPSMSTVTYLTDSGAPTLILNMTTVDGNSNHPMLPDEAFLIAPRRNKHMSFPGNYMHGVPGSLATRNARQGSGDIRITFLVNWWAHAPKPPNCVELTAAEVERFQEGSGTNYAAQPTQPGQLDHMAVGKDTASWELIMLPPNERLHLLVPSPEQFTASLPDVRLAWGADTQALGGVGELDLHKDYILNYIFSSAQPKLFVFTDGTPDPDLELDILRALRPYLGRIIPFFAVAEKTADAMDVLGIAGNPLPAVVMHDTVSDEKTVMSHSGASWAGRDLAAFVASYLAAHAAATDTHEEL